MEPSLPPILCFVGRSNSGKTTLIERVIPVLVREGYRIATIKHAGHGFDLDTEGKDSWRLKRAGAKTVLVTSKGSLAMFAEGWKSEGYPKVVVVRDHVGEVEVLPEGLLALVSNKPLDQVPGGVPVFHPDDISGLASLIGKRFPLRRGPRA